MFISFEGPEACGKSTQISLLQAHLTKLGLKVLSLREPGGTELGERLRPIIKDPSLKINPLAQLMLFLAARAQIVEESIQPALKNGQIVLCDRFIDSTEVYQGPLMGQDGVDFCSSLNQRVTQNLLPNLTLVFDLDLMDVKKRLAHRNGPIDRFDQYQDTQHQNLIQAYRLLAQKYPSRIRLINARLTPEQVFNEVLNTIKPHIKLD